jgi:hypothetical protein
MVLSRQELTCVLLAAMLAVVCPASLAAAESAAMPLTHDCLKVTWTTPSRDALGAIPLGNGDISVNAWAEENGDLLLYVGKCDSWDENGRLLKLGRLRLHFSHNPFAAGQPFRQTLHADRAEIEIVSGESPRESRIRVWVDANRPVLRIEMESDQEFELETRLEVWRTSERELAVEEDSCPIGKASADELTKVTPDTVLDLPDALAWCHRNERSVWASTLRHQDLGELIPKFRDPLLGLSSGGLVIALQRMLLQWDGDRILLLPAWPKDWDVSFKLHAPRQTTVKCVYRSGKVESLKVTPESRRSDVELILSASAGTDRP